MATCNICGKTSFIPGPGGRLSRSGKPPLCEGCRSAERHRAARALGDKVRKGGKLSGFSFLNWGEQGSVAKGWFASAESAPSDAPDGGLGARPDQSIDFILSANVLQRTPDHRRAIADIVRVLRQDGLAMLYYTNPAVRDRTEDWGAPDPKRGDARRVIGRDFEAEYATIVPDAIVFRVQEADPVTGDEELVYLLTKSPGWMRRLTQIGLNARILD